MIAGIVALSCALIAAQGSPASANRITGRVTDASSAAPIGGAVVALMLVVDLPNGATLGNPPRQSTTDTTGAFAFDGLPSGQYTVNVQKTGFAAYPDVFTDGMPDRLMMDGKIDVSPLNIALNRGAVLTGKIVTASGEPEAGLDVVALRRADRAGWPAFVPTGHAETNDLGEFRMAGLSAGDYLVLTSVPSHGPFDAVSDATTTLAPTYFPGTLDQHAAGVTTLAAGQVRDGLDFAIKTAAAFHVSGVVVDAAGHPSPHAIVMLTSDWRTSGMLEPQMSIAADDGTFTIGSVIPGTYQIVADANDSAGGGMGSHGMNWSTSEGSVGGSKSNAAMITVTGADITGLKVVVRDK